MKHVVRQFGNPNFLQKSRVLLCYFNSFSEVSGFFSSLFIVFISLRKSKPNLQKEVVCRRKREHFFRKMWTSEIEVITLVNRNFSKIRTM